MGENGTKQCELQKYPIKEDNQFLLIKFSEEQKKYSAYYGRCLTDWALNLIDNGNELKIAKLWDKEQINFSAPQLKVLNEKVKDLFIYVSDMWDYIREARSAIRTYSGVYKYHENFKVYNYLQNASKKILHLQQKLASEHAAANTALVYSHNLAASLLVTINSWQILHFEPSLIHQNNVVVPAVVAQTPIRVAPQGPAPLIPELPAVVGVGNVNTFFTNPRKVGERNLKNYFDIAFQVAQNGGNRREQIAAQNMNRPRL